MAELIPVDHDPFAQTERPKITVTPTQRAFLNAMRGGESGGRYNVMYGGKTFDDYSDHPRQPQPIRSGPNAGNVSTAAGADQFLARTWDEAKNALGLPDFSPESQDAAAVWLAERDYGKRTGRNLWDDLEGAKDSPGKLNYLGSALSKTWTSLPNGAEPNSATAGFGQRLASEFSSQQRGPTVSVKPYNSEQPKLVPVDHDPFAEPQDVPRKQVGMGEAIGRGIQQGATFNFGDEITGLKAASGIPAAAQTVASVIPGANLIAPVVGAARMGYDALTGGNTATDAYTQASEAQREANNQAQSQRPGSYLAGNVAGAVAVPVGGILNAATMPARIGRGIAVGAGAGGLAGAGEGESAADRASRATFGAGIGGVIGGAAVPVVDAAGALVRSATQPIANTLRGFRDPEGEAARRVVTAMRRDAGAGDLGITAPEYAASRAAGTPVANVDIGGETTRALARSAANTSPEARGALTRMSDARFETQGPRTASFIQNLVGLPADAPATREGLKDLARRVNEPLYKRAYEKGADGIWTPEIERLASSEAVVGAMQSALKKVSDENVISGYGAMNPRITFSQDGRIQFNRKPNGMPAYPDLQFWDLTRRELSDAAKNAGYGTSEARRLETLAKSLNKELDRAVPEYGAARGTAARFFDVGDALEAGEAFLTQKSVKEMAPVWGKMSPVEKTLFAEGFTSSLIDKINKVGDRRSILNAIDNSTDARQRLNMALGPQKANELRAFLRVEGVMDKMRGALGNSTTARQLIESGLAGGATLGYSGDPTTAMSAAGAWMALRYGGKLAGQKIDQGVARRVGEMLASNDPAILRKGIQLVSKSGGLQKALRAIDDQIAKFGGVQTEKGFIPIQSVSAPRAEDEQPNVNGPRRQ